LGALIPQATIVLIPFHPGDNVLYIVAPKKKKKTEFVEIDFFLKSSSNI